MHAPLRTACRFLVVLLCLAAVGAQARSLVVASLNVRNYNAIDRRADGTWQRDYPKAEAEKQALRLVIHAVHPDILLLQEIGPRPYLDELVRDLGREGLDYPYAAHLQAQDADRCLAALSMVPFAAEIPHVELAYSLGGQPGLVRRGLLELQVDVDGHVLTLYTLHLKSRLTDDPADPLAARQREAEAEAVRRTIRTQEKDRVGGFLIAGDLNDTPGSAAHRRFTTLADQPWAVDLRPTDTRAEAWTYMNMRTDTYERVDYLFVSPKLIEYVQQGTSFIYDGPSALGGSDHRMIAVTLNFPAEVPKK